MPSCPLCPFRLQRVTFASEAGKIEMYREKSQAGLVRVLIHWEDVLNDRFASADNAARPLMRNVMMLSANTIRKD